MKRRNKIFIWIGVIGLLLTGAYYLILPRVVAHMWSLEPRDPKLEVAVTHEIGWWSYQEALQVDSFSVAFVESRLNLLNSKSLVRYTVKGKLFNKMYWKPSIEHVHISQRFLRKKNPELHPYLDRDTTNYPEAIIEITPVIAVVRDQNYLGEELYFEFTNELTLESFHWGNNWVRFQCINQEEDLILKQRK